MRWTPVLFWLCATCQASLSPLRLQSPVLLDELDRVNHQQNDIRQRLTDMSLNYQEIEMAIQNIRGELEKQRAADKIVKYQLQRSIRILYQVRRDGLLRFLISNQEIATPLARMRVFLFALRSHEATARALKDRENRLADTEKQLLSLQDEAQTLLSVLQKQQNLLTLALEKKKKVLTRLNQKNIGSSSKNKMTRELNQIFHAFENSNGESSLFPNKGSLPVPLEFGKIVKNFGKSIHEKFHTVTYQKGIEIEAAHNTPVTSILPGSAEFGGWVKGLGNVVIINHGGGFHSLHAHLFKSIVPQGSRVQQGEVIGYVGDTGNNEKPSLYFELRENGKAVDPLAYFSRDALSKWF